MQIAAPQALARVTARLERPPRDSLEAAVVLEAWGGLTASRALELAPSTTASGAARDAPPPLAETDVHDAPAHEGAEMVGLLVALVATIVWIAPLADAIGRHATSRAWQMALPAALGLQWALRRRYLSGPDGLGRLRRDVAVAAAAGLVAICVQWVFLATPGATLAAGLVVTWLSSMLLARRGWAVSYSVFLIGAAVAMTLGVRPVLDVEIVLGVTVTAVYAAITTAPVSQRQPGAWPRSAVAGVVGTTLALMVVLDPAAGWATATALPVIALVPSLVAGAWAGWHLSRIWATLPAVLAQVEVTARNPAGPRGFMARMFLGVLLRLVGTTAVLSVATVRLVTAWSPHDASHVGSLLVGVGAFGTVAFTAGALEALDRTGWALSVAAVGVCVVEVLVHLPWRVPVDPLAPAAAVCAVLAAVPVLGLIRHPDRMLATAGLR